jgi:hypothetical protein
MNHFFVLLFVVALSSCANGDITLDQIVNNPVEFEKQAVSLDSASFSVMIPKVWNWRNENEDCDGENVLIMLNAGSPSDKDGYIDIISIQKIKSQSNSNDLETEYNHLLKLSKNQSQRLKMVESGKTDALNYPAYYFHTKSDTGTYGETESISFIVKSEDQGFFYHLIACASQTELLNENMSIMIHSLKTFKIKS